MIEFIPKNVNRVFVYFHSAGVNSEELSPVLELLKDRLPNTYILALDGFISGSPTINRGAFYGESEEKYWFMFPMQDASSQESFIVHKAQLGATLLTAAAYTNNLIDQFKNRFNLGAEKVFLCGFQHGSCLVLATAMMRQKDPLSAIFLIQPYIMEALYLDSELRQEKTKVYGIENEFMRNKTYSWVQIYTEIEMNKIGIPIESIITKEGDEHITNEIVESMCSLIIRES